MKTNRFARGLSKIRTILFCVAVVVIGGLGMNLGESFTARSATVTALPTAVPQAPNANFGDLMAAGRY